MMANDRLDGIWEATRNRAFIADTAFMAGAYRCSDMLARGSNSATNDVILDRSRLAVNQRSLHYRIVVAIRLTDCLRQQAEGQRTTWRNKVTIGNTKEGWTHDGTAMSQL